MGIIYFLFESNTFAWKTQWNYLGVFGNFLGDVSVQSYYYLRICVSNKYIWHIHRISKDQWAIILLSSIEYICWNRSAKIIEVSRRKSIFIKKKVILAANSHKLEKKGFHHSRSSCRSVYTHLECLCAFMSWLAWGYWSYGVMFWMWIFKGITPFLFFRPGRGSKLSGGTGRWAIILWNLGTFLIFPNFLRSYVLSRSTTPLYHVYK